MRIGIRADGGSKIGMGHIMRTLVLAEELLKGHNVVYICRTDGETPSKKYGNGIRMVLSRGFEVILVRESNLVEDLMKIDLDLLITDSYDVDGKYFCDIKKIFNKTAYIDDMNLYYFNVDYLINQNINAKDFKYRVNTDTKLLLGTDYVMLRKEFRKVPSKTINRNVCDIMITVGGSDPNHITGNILQWIKEINYVFHVVVGCSFSDKEELKAFESDNVKLYFNANMFKLMEKCDLAVTACGSTLYELAACGVPVLGIVIADNQRGIAEKLNKLGVIKYLGWYSNIEKESFVNSLITFSKNYEQRNNCSKLASKLVDGKGVERICRILTGM